MPETDTMDALIELKRKLDDLEGDTRLKFAARVATNETLEKSLDSLKGDHKLLGQALDRHAERVQAAQAVIWDRLHGLEKDYREVVAPTKGSEQNHERRITDLEERARGIAKPRGAWDWPEKAEKRITELEQRMGRGHVEDVEYADSVNHDLLKLKREVVVLQGWANTLKDAQMTVDGKEVSPAYFLAKIWVLLDSITDNIEKGTTRVLGNLGGFTLGQRLEAIMNRLTWLEAKMAEVVEEVRRHGKTRS